MDDQQALTFSIRYDGGLAEHHAIEMGGLGSSLSGVNRLIRDGLFIAVERRLPRQRERLPIEVVARPPRPHCVDIDGFIAATTGLLPLAQELLLGAGGNLTYDILSYVLTLRGGRPRQADQHLASLVSLIGEMHKINAQGEMARLENEASWRAGLLQLATMSGHQAKLAVSPVGPSCDLIRLSDPLRARSTIIDEPMAKVIRAGEPNVVSDMVPVRFRIDQITKHNRQLKVELPDSPENYIPADVRDPAFDSFPNPYSDAFANDRVIEVDAKVTSDHSGSPVRLFVLNYRGE